MSEHALDRTFKLYTETKLDTAIEVFRQRFKAAGPFHQKMLIEGLNELGSAPVEAIDNPDVIASRGRPKSKKVAECSTKRDPSAFEFVQKRKSNVPTTINPGTTSKHAPSAKGSPRTAATTRRLITLLHRKILSIWQATPTVNPLYPPT